MSDIGKNKAENKAANGTRETKVSGIIILT